MLRTKEKENNYKKLIDFLGIFCVGAEFRATHNDNSNRHQLN